MEALLGAVRKLKSELHRGDPRDVEEEGDKEAGDDVERGHHDDRGTLESLDCVK